MVAYELLIMFPNSSPGLGKMKCSTIHCTNKFVVCSSHFARREREIKSSSEPKRSHSRNKFYLYPLVHPTLFYMDHNYYSAYIGAEARASTAATIDGETKPNGAGLSKISVKFPSIKT